MDEWNLLLSRDTKLAVCILIVLDHRCITVRSLKCLDIQLFKLSNAISRTQNTGGHLDKVAFNFPLSLIVIPAIIDESNRFNKHIDSKD